MKSWGWRWTACVLAVAAATSGCTELVPGVGTFAALRPAPDAKVQIEGLPGGKPTEVDRIAGNALADVEAYWTEQMPQTFGIKYKPVSGGIYSIDPNDSSQSIPCVRKASEIRGNAFYCPKADVVAWDRVDLLPALQKRFGPFPIAMVLAHELGHAVQARTREPGTKTIVVETQADCYAGAWTRAAFDGNSTHFQLDRKSLDDAVGGYLLFRDPVGNDPNDMRAHGNAFDRVSAFQEGFEQGPEHCKGFDDSRQFTEAPFTDPRDDSSGGNLPFEQAIELGTDDLRQYWERMFATSFHRTWKQVAGVKSFDGDSGSGRPSCGGRTIRQAVAYCPADNTIYYDGPALNRVYVKAGNGDFAPMTLIAAAYGQVARNQLGKQITGEDAVLSAVCLAGAYAGDTTRNPTAHRARLSPGDLDESVQALLTFGGTFLGVPNTAGFVRIKAFRQGFADIANCG
jgi:predicted metalloprotease